MGYMRERIEDSMFIFFEWKYVRGDKKNQTRSNQPTIDEKLEYNRCIEYQSFNRRNNFRYLI